MLQSIVLRTVTLSVRSLAFSCLLLSSAFAAEPVTADPVKFKIEPQPLGNALNEFARQSDRELLFATEVVENKEAQLVVGVYEPEEALALLLADTGLEYSVTDNDTFLVDEAEDQGNRAAAGATLKPVTMAQNQTVAQPSRAIEASEASEREIEREHRSIEEIIVTGTNIRGIAPESSPVRVFDRQDIQSSGAATAQDFIQTLPQNFGGGSNISHLFNGLPNDDSTRFNDPYYGGAGGASVNLHGLGSGATLVLLNGHRVAPSSGIGDFVDISMIPASALARVETLTDGASSIYGGDAVAGVVNFILRDDFDGVETSLRYGTVTEGDLDQYRANLTAGRAWDTGHALFVYEYFSQDDLSAADRSFPQEVPLPTDLLPDQKRHSALVSVSHEVTPDTELFADLIVSERKMVHHNTIPRDPGFVTRLTTSKSDSWSISAGGSHAFDNDWILDTSVTYSNSQTEGEYESTTPALVHRTVDSKLWTVDAKVSGAVLQLPGGALKLAFGGHYRPEAFSNVGAGHPSSLAVEIERKADRDVYALFGEAYIPIVGPDNALPGIARLDINASGRLADHSDFGSTANPKVGVLWSPFEGLNLRGSYSTSFNPPPLGRVGSRDLSVLVYPSLWINTLLGYTPGDPSIADVDIISVNGTSKDLEAEESRAFTAGVDLNRQWGDHRLSARATYFDIEFDGRLGDTPVPDGSTIFNVPNIAFDHPEVFPEGAVIFFPTLDQINAVLNSADLPINALFGADPLNASVIHFTNVVRNLSLTLVRGIDFDVTYTFESERERGTFALGLAGTYFIDFERQAAVTTPIVEQLNTLNNPLDLTLRGRAGYANNGFTANLFLNYQTDYRVDNRPGAARIDSWTTVDLSLVYDTRQIFGDSVLSHTIVRLSVTNLLDKDPPSVPSVSSYSGLGFDPSNASPLGRFIAVELTKSF